MSETVRRLRALGAMGQVAALVAIVAASALVELAGAVALVPLLQTLAPEPVGGVIGAIADFASPLGLVGLLVLFVVLTALRAALAHWRVLATFNLEITVVDRLRARAFSGLLAADWRALSRMRQSDNRALLVSTIDQVGLLVHQGAGVVALAVNLAALGLAALALRAGRERIERRTRTPVTRLRVAGGGSQSDAAMQILADVFGLPAQRSHTHETSGLGAAINAAVGLGWHPDHTAAARAMVHDGARFEPDPDTSRRYDRLYHEVYRGLYPALAPTFRRIAGQYAGTGFRRAADNWD